MSATTERNSQDMDKGYTNATDLLIFGTGEIDELDGGDGDDAPNRFGEVIWC